LARNIPLVTDLPLPPLATLLSLRTPCLRPRIDVSDRIPRLRVFDLKSLENKNL
jgi:hypothetical protein